MPTFACQFCAAELSTEKYAGTGAVRADEMRAYLHGLLEQPGAIPEAPKLVHGDGGTREAQCAHCGATLVVPLTITVSTVRCDACGKSEPVNRYVSDGERLKLDMARQIAGNQALAELVRTGMHCPKCGAHNVIAQPVPVQVACSTCRHAILLSDFVPADAIDRARLKHSVLGLKEGITARQTQRARTERYVVLAVFLVVGIAAVIVLLLSRV